MSDPAPTWRVLRVDDFGSGQAQVTYQLPDGKLARVITARNRTSPADLDALGSRLYEKLRPPRRIDET